MKKLILTVFLLSIIGSPLFSMGDDDDIDENDINHARVIALNILNRNHGDQLESGVNNIMTDHSLSHHSSGDSYFVTDDPTQIKSLVHLVSSNPDKFKFYKVSNRRGGMNYRLAISKLISIGESNSLFNIDHIGYDEKHSKKRFRAVLCFGINGMKKLSDSNDTGGFLTGFPAREDYVLGI
jgi:hypothetical protein